MKYYTSIEIYNVEIGELIWIKKERVLGNNKYVQNASELIIGLDENDFDSEKSLLSAAIPNDDMVIYDTEYNRTKPLTIKLMARAVAS